MLEQPIDPQDDMFSLEELDDLAALTRRITSDNFFDMAAHDPELLKELRLIAENKELFKVYKDGLSPEAKARLEIVIKEKLSKPSHASKESTDVEG